MSSSTNGILLVALAVGGAYMIISNSNKPAVYRTSSGIVATSTNGIRATNFNSNLNAGSLQGIAWSRSNGSDEDYALKLNDVYNETYGKGKW